MGQHKLKILVVGASGATGIWLVKHLLDGGHRVKVVVRSKERFAYKSHPGISLTEAGILDLRDDDISRLVKGCDAVASCLGHNISLKGIYGKPRKLVTEATQRLCRAIQDTGKPDRVKFVLMNTSGNLNRDLKENISMAHRMAIVLIRILLPPQNDNERAAEYLRKGIGHNNTRIQWVVVRPDGLINEDSPTEYVTFPSPTRDAIFSPGKVSRINVAHFMAQLITDDRTWDRWKGQMPVVYNKGFS